MISNKEIAAIFNLTGEVLTLLDENPFKVRSYFAAAQSIKNYPVPLATLSEDEILKIKGIGKNLLPKVMEIIRTGDLEFLHRKAEKIPDGILELLQIKGLGPKKVKQLWQELGITSPGELLYACYENRLVDLKGFGQKTQEKIQKTLEFYFQNKHKFHYPAAFEYALEIINFLKTKYNLEQIEITGVLRRKCETVKHIDLLVCSEQEVIIENLDFSPIPVNLHYSPPEQKAFRLLITTGSQQHLEKLHLKGFEFAETEEEIYAKNHLPYIPPELRENLFEWELTKNQHPINLIEEKDIKGLVHCHTVWSDGTNTIEEMALAARDKGMEYVVITDHSKSAFYANGLSEERIIQQQKEIKRLNDKNLGIQILSGIEADILPDGSLDYDHNVLQSFDVVIASVHSVLHMDKHKATGRILKAIENPHVHIIGHISGRLLLSRLGYELDYDKIFDACIQNNVILEINANPMRLDIDWKQAGKAREKGVKFSINPDAHNAEGINHIQYGVNTARKAGITPDNVVNCLSADEFKNAIKK